MYCLAKFKHMALGKLVVYLVFLQISLDWDCRIFILHDLFVVFLIDKLATHLAKKSLGYMAKAFGEGVMGWGSVMRL